MGIISEKIEKNIITVDIKSTNLKKGVYDTESKVLTIIFNNGSIYEYYNFPWEIFTKFRMTDSQGKFFSTNINGKYDYKKIS